MIDTLSRLLILMETLKGILYQDYCNIPVDNYCKKYSSHTLCLPDPDPPCVDEICEFGEDDIKKILDFHNGVRQRVSSGMENKAKDGETLPSASNMCELKWDCELARIAQKLAEQCKFEFDCDECRDVYDKKRFCCAGQNIAYEENSSKATDKMKLLLAAADRWYSTEVGNFGSSVIDSYVFDSKYSAYSQLIWAKTCYVGCGCSIYLKDGFYRYQIVCNYGPCGNVNYEPVYLKGKPCSACPSSCSQNYNALCV